ncbi:MAG: sulfatase [Candidatus Sumerlaeota bacterium]
MSNSKPNIVYIHSHDTGRYIQPYGYAVPTPNLQKLAEQGVIFRQAFCANPTCSASRAALLTGCYPHQNGMEGLAHRGWSLNDYKMHLVHTLKGAGYRTALSGVQHVASHREGEPYKTIGYDEYLGHPGEAELKAAQYIRNYDSKEPFFLAVGFGETHRDFPERLEEDNPNYLQPPAPLPDTPETRKDMADYIAIARRLDRKMGVVFNAIEDAGIEGETLVICTTDHGIAFPRMKCNLTDDGIGIMLLMRGPAGFEGGKCVDALVSHVDIFPTLCDMLDIERPDWLEGESVLPLVNGEKDVIHDEIFAEVNYHASYEPMRCVRTDRYKYIRRFDGRSRPVLPNCDDSVSKTLWYESGWLDQEVAEESFFDLMFDPHETSNQVDNPRYKNAVDMLRNRMEEWRKATGDPLLENDVVPAPEKAVVNDPDKYSPKDRPDRVSK